MVVEFLTAESCSLLDRLYTATRESWVDMYSIPETTVTLRRQ